jgi:hypothetical protein
MWPAKEKSLDITITGIEQCNSLDVRHYGSDVATRVW